MGYRSEVSLAIKKEVYNKHYEKVQESISSCDKLLQTEIAYVFIWESIKWYDSYDDIKILESFLAEIDDDDYGFIRIGEDTDDIETKGDTSSYELYVQRSISEPRGSEEVPIKDFFAANSVKFIQKD